jgi:pimeloyl-ACP methyl ester carboxylesterase
MTIQRVSIPSGDVRYRHAGQGAPVVLLHPLRTQLEYFDRLTALLDPSRFEVLAIDLPGHGGSSAPAVDYTAKFFSDAVEQVLDHCDRRGVTIVGDSIGGAIGLTLAARHNARVSRVIAVNPYDYGRRGGIRRSSRLANLLFTLILFPIVGPVIARNGTKGVLRRILAGGLHDPGLLPADLVDAVARSGILPGHARAFRSLMLQWKTWVDGRAAYPLIEVPVTLVYGQDDWSRPSERSENATAIPGAHVVTLAETGHFASLEKPHDIARLIDEA